MARWAEMTIGEQVKLLENRLEQIKTCQRLLSDFERMTAYKLEGLKKEMEENEQ